MERFELLLMWHNDIYRRNRRNCRYAAWFPSKQRSDSLSETKMRIRSIALHVSVTSLVQMISFVLLNLTMPLRAIFVLMWYCESWLTKLRNRRCAEVAKNETYDIEQSLAHHSTCEGHLFHINSLQLMKTTIALGASNVHGTFNF